jgi:hypothetical protein
LGSEPTTMSRVTTRRHQVVLTSDADGRFSRDDLSPGVYGVTFSVDGASYSLQLDVGPEADLVLDLAELPAGVAVSPQR